MAALHRSMPSHQPTSTTGASRKPSILEHVVAVWTRTLAEEDRSRLASENELAGALQAAK